MPLLSSGHKTGLTSFYAGTLPRGRLEHVAATCSRYELRAGQGGVTSAGLEADCVKSYDQLLAGAQSHEDTETQRHTGDSTSGSGVHHSEAEDVSETDVLVPTFSPSVMMEKY